MTTAQTSTPVPSPALVGLRDGIIAEISQWPCDMSYADRLDILWQGVIGKTVEAAPTPAPVPTSTPVVEPTKPRTRRSNKPNLLARAMVTVHRADATRHGRLTPEECLEELDKHHPQVLGRDRAANLKDIKNNYTKDSRRWRKHDDGTYSLKI
jgi:hypothetical protein